jgi:hypothetical protein
MFGSISGRDWRTSTAARSRVAVTLCVGDSFKNEMSISTFDFFRHLRMVSFR